MPRWEHTVKIDSPPERVWEVMSDIDRWPTWTESMVAARKLTDGPLRNGTEAMVQPKGTPESTWIVTEATPGRGFTWETKVRGAHTVAGHVIEPVDGGSRVTLSVEVRGFVAALLRPVLSRGVIANMKAEAAGLKRESEAVAAPR